MKTKSILFVILASLFLINFALIVSCDVITPKITIVNFDVNGKAYTKPVDFKVDCFGYKWSPGPSPAHKAEGSYTPEKVFSYFATCEKYGCQINENFYLNYRHLDYCNISGTANNKEFTIEKYATTPLPKCESVINVTEELLNQDNTIVYQYKGIIKPGLYIRSEEFNDCLRQDFYPEQCNYEGCENPQRLKKDTSQCYKYLTPVDISKYDLSKLGYPIENIEQICKLNISLPDSFVIDLEDNNNSKEIIDNKNSENKEDQTFCALNSDCKSQVTNKARNPIVCFFRRLFGKSC
ncbi:MAG: hypothetical protein V1824_02960 [archaeon]